MDRGSTTVAAGGLLDSGGAMDRSATMAMAIVEIEIRIEGSVGGGWNGCRATDRIR